MYYKYLVVRCEELKDQYECDVNRTPLCLTNDFQKYKKYGYEIYEMFDNGSLTIRWSWEGMEV